MEGVKDIERCKWGRKGREERDRIKGREKERGRGDLGGVF